jgi:hypothetical protein
MSHTKIVHTRKPGWCSSEFAHPGQINFGDRILVITYFPGDEEVRDFGVPAFSRVRVCSWCLGREEDTGWRTYQRPRVAS